jgi:hypothetical protein
LEQSGWSEAAESPQGSDERSKEASANGHGTAATEKQRKRMMCRARAKKIKPKLTTLLILIQSKSHLPRLNNFEHKILGGRD